MKLYHLNQYEIKHLPILNFENEVRPIISKYMKLFNNIKISEEGTHNEQIHLTSTEESYEIIVKWDTIILRVDQDLGALSDMNNTPVKIFFLIYNEIREVNTFPNTVSHLLYNLSIKLNEESIDEQYDLFSTKYLKNSVVSMLDKGTDGSIILQRRSEGEFIHQQFGPYIGIDDLKNRKINILDENYLQPIYDKYGLILEIRQHIANDSVNDDNFIEIINSVNDRVNLFWNGQ